MKRKNNSIFFKMETINVVMDRSFLNNLEVSPMSDIATNESMQYLI
jgi:hypothetical protein